MQEPLPIGTAIARSITNAQTESVTTSPRDTSAAGPLHHQAQQPLSLRTPHLLFPTDHCLHELPARILVSGPAKSGKTSILMDTAVALALAAPCRCSNLPNACVCVAVTVFLRQDESSSYKNHDFPLRCRPATGGNHSWDRKALARIQVRYVRSARSILEYLLSIQGKPSCQHPLGALMVDDLDRFFHEGHGTPSQMQMTQFLAMLSDSADALGTVNSTLTPTILAVTSKPFPVPWMTTDVRLISLPETHYEATVTSRAKGKPSTCWKVGYGVAEAENGDREIVWNEVMSSK